MIDFIKLEFEVNQPELILNDSKLNFSGPVNLQSGEIVPARNGYNKQMADIKGMKLEYIQNTKTERKFFELSGSIHKYFHEGMNYKDYTLNELEQSINDISDILNINPTETKIHRIEFGVNITLPHLTQMVLNSIVTCKGKPHELRRYEGKGFMKLFQFAQYHVKVYNKGLQYPNAGNLMRFEVKVNRMDYLLKKGVKIESLADLLNSDILHQLRNLLKHNIENLLFTDYRINPKDIKNKRERFLLTQGMRSEFWEEYKQSHTNKAYYKKLKRFREIVLKYAPGNLHSEIQELILQKWDLLNSTPILPRVIGPEVPQYYTHIVGNNTPSERRYCLTCKRDISDQRTGSLYCSEKLYGKEVKKCRNKVSNRKRFEQRHYQNELLFDIPLMFR